MNCRLTFKGLKAKNFLLLILFTAALQPAFAQSNKAIDSLMTVLKTAQEDTNKANALNVLCKQLARKPDTSAEIMKYGNDALTLAEKLNYKKGMAAAYTHIAQCFSNQTNFTAALKNHLAALKIREETGDKLGLAQTYHNIGIDQSRQNDYTEALINLRTALKIQEEIGDKQGMVDSYVIIGLVHSDQGNYPEALTNQLAALKISKEIGNKKGVAYAYNNIGEVYRFLGNYPEALKNQLASLKIKEELGNKLLMAASYNNIAIIYDLLGSYPEALKNYRAALQIAEELKNKFGIATCKGNIGIINVNMGHYSEALENQHAALKIWEEIGSKGGIATAYSNIGDVYRSQGNSPEALKNYLAALKIAEEIGDHGTMAFCYNNIGKVYLNIKKYLEAKQYLMNGLSLAKEIGGKENIKDAYDGLSKLDSAIGNYQQALVHYKLYTDYKDSMLNETSSKQIAQMKEQYESEKKDREILQLSGDKQKLESEKQISALENEKIQALNLYSRQQIELLGNEKKLQLLQIEKEKADNAVQKAETDKKHGQLVVLNKEKDIQTLQLNKQKQTKNFLIAGLILFAVLSFFVYRNYRTRHQLKLQTLRNKIASDLHDDVGSTLSSISIFSQMAQAQSKEVIPALETIGESSRKMLDAMADIVWTIHPENDQFEKIIMRMRSFAYELLGAKQIDFEFEADDDVTEIKLSMEARKNLYLIFKEATNNMVKYSEATKAMFAIKGEKDKLTMMIRDNGKGFDATKESSGNGLKNMKKRALEIGASLFIDSTPGNGTTIKLELAA